MFNLNPISIYTKLIQNPKTKWITIILTGLYIISPIDLIPDVLLPFGLIDDGLIITCLIIALKSLKKSKIEEPNMNQKKGPVVDEQ